MNQMPKRNTNQMTEADTRIEIRIQKQNESFLSEDNDFLGRGSG